MGLAVQEILKGVFLVAGEPEREHVARPRRDLLHLFVFGVGGWVWLVGEGKKREGG